MREKATVVEFNRTAQSVQDVGNGGTEENVNELYDWADCIGLDDQEVVVESTNTVENELSNYMAEKNITRDKSPFLW